MKWVTRSMIVMLSALVAVEAAGLPAWAEPDKEQLKVQFRAREDELRQLKKQGTVGETVEGYVEAVDAGAAGDQKIAALVSEENRDRRALYQILADEINKEHPQAAVKATTETIATRNAARNIEHATPEEFLRVGKGHWIRVKDFPRYQKLVKFKTQGKVGETGAGQVAIVQDADKSDRALASLVDEENARRAAEYKTLAQKEKSDAAAVARRAGARNIENARIGDMVKDEGGAWRKK